MKNTIIIMTSNIGSQYIDISNKEERDTKIRTELRTYFRIEFLNRIDDIVIYDALTESEIHQIAHLMLTEVEHRLATQGILVSWSQSLIDRISQLGYDPSLGARPLKRAITEYIINPLSEKILMGEVTEGDSVEVGMGDKNELLIQKR